MIGDNVRANASMGEFASREVQDSERCYMWTLSKLKLSNARCTHSYHRSTASGYMIVLQLSLKDGAGQHVCLQRPMQPLLDSIAMPDESAQFRGHKMI